MGVGKSFESHQVLCKGKESLLSLVTVYICQGLGRGLSLISWFYHMELEAAFDSDEERGIEVPEPKTRKLGRGVYGKEF